MNEKIEIIETVDGIAAPSATRSAGKDAEKTMKRNVTGKAAPRRLKADPFIWGIYLMLLMISVVELFSASSTEVKASNIYEPLIRHAIFLGLGLAIVLWLQRTHYGYLGRFAWFIAIVSLGLLLLSSFIGVEINGAQRAINVAGFTIQPAEIVKLSVVLLLSYILGRNQEPRGVKNKGIIMSAVVVVVFGACLWKNGLTNTILLMCVSMCLMLIGGIPWKKFALIACIYGVCGGALYMMKYAGKETTEFEKVEQMANVDKEEMAQSQSTKIDRTGTQKGRFRRYLEGVSPTDPITDDNRQVVFAKFAMANGGVIGQGPGNSRESARLPLAFSDYIYSIIVEDTGFAGGVFLLVLYLCLLARAGRVAYQCSRAFPAFLIMGCAVMIVFQALVHMAIVTGLFPVSGQPLPLISKGGTSVLVMSAAIGIMLSVSRFAVKDNNKKELAKELEALPEGLEAANFSGVEEAKRR